MAVLPAERADSIASFVSSAFNEEGSGSSGSIDGISQGYDIGQLIGDLENDPIKTVRKKDSRITARDDQADFGTDGFYISRDMMGEVITIGTTPTLIKQPSYAQKFLMLNPHNSQPIVATGLTPITAGAAGNSIVNPVKVGGSEVVHIFLNVTAITAADLWNFDMLSYDSLSGGWADVLQAFANIGAVGTYGITTTIGIADSIAFSWNPPVAPGGTVTFSINIVKQGASENVDLSDAIFIGGSGVTTISGYPIPKGHEKKFVLGEGVALYGIAYANTDIRLFRV
jgi:hypothetical protein